MERTFGSYLVQPLAQRLLTEMLQICLFNSSLNISKDGCNTGSLCNLSQCLTKWENVSFMSSRNLCLSVVVGEVASHPLLCDTRKILSLSSPPHFR